MTTPADEAIDLREYVAVLRRRKWTVLLVTGAMLSAAALYSFTRPPLYTAQAEILVQPTNPSSQFRADQLVSVETEASLASSTIIARIVRDDSDLSMSVQELVERVAVASDPESLVIALSFTDPDPANAATGANAFAQSYLRYRQDQAQEVFSSQQELIQRLIQRAEDDQSDLLTELKGVASESSTAIALQEEIQNLNTRIAIFTTQLLSVPVPTSPGQVILPADEPMAPSSPKHAVNLALGLFLGLFFGVFAAFTKDRLDDRMRDWENQESILRAPVLATIPPVVGWSRKSSPWLVTEQQPRSPAAEAFRTLRTGIMGTARQENIKTLAITSATKGEGKSTTSAHLASALSIANQRTLLISADLRAPRVHEFFGMDNSSGLSDVLLGESSLRDATTPVSPSLWFLSAGTPPARPAELLHSQRFVELLHEVEKHYDFVVIDCAPILGLADSLVIAPLVDGVLFVSKSDVSRDGVVMQAVDSLRQAGARIVAGVFVDVNRSKRGPGYGYGDGYGYGYGYENEKGDGSVDEGSRIGRRRRRATPVARPDAVARGLAELESLPTQTAPREASADEPGVPPSDPEPEDSREREPLQGSV